MNIDQLEGVLTLVADLGEGATEAVYSVIMVMILSEVTGLILGLTFMGLLVYMGKWLVSKLASPNIRLQQLRDAAGIGSSGALTTSEFREMLRMIKKGQREAGYD